MLPLWAVHPTGLLHVAAIADMTVATSSSQLKTTQKQCVWRLDCYKCTKVYVCLKLHAARVKKYLHAEQIAPLVSVENG